MAQYEDKMLNALASGNGPGCGAPAVPVLVGFILVQKQLVSGLTAGAVKG